jgi:gluconate:H+ symporter, GntP family
MDPLLILLLGIVVVAGSILLLRFHPFLALILGALLVASLTPRHALEQHAVERKISDPAAFAAQPVAERLAREFGNTCARVGILIALAAIIGKCLLDSGAADRIVRSALAAVGEKRAALALLGTGFLLGVPVFFDTVFFLMIPLAKTLARRTGRNYALYVMSIIAGTSMAHSLVPPTPGPLFVARELRIETGEAMLVGLLVGLFTCVIGYCYAQWANRRWDLPLRDSPETALEDLDRWSGRPNEELPKLWLSLLPVVLPVLLIGGNSVLQFALAQSALRDLPVVPVALALGRNLGNPNVALALAALIALGTLARQRKEDRPYLSSAVHNALAGGGVIILITAAGGAFGGVLQQTGIGSRIEDLAAAHQLPILPLAFFLTALVRTAQGSATVAMITTVGLVSNLADPAVLGFHPVYLAMAIGCGSKPFPWMNDSGFWVIGKMSGMTVPETFRNFSSMISLMGLGGLLFTMLLAKVLPLN